ncbi:ABC-F family ATP-binding cassette domain-containing protein [Glaciihabitans arcticus]|uniref:ABC-F family ATP-binding cassette domain-containing protein n=1 Tax=Glaciihabitans arcticus TaxID=2668039 RepID=A0A4Q9GMI4_9MICO|nr:ABC-F family ATP-binding cassette domain-containing protein [Glaciihabitans arcticus]
MSLSGISHSFGDRAVFSDLSLVIDGAERLGLIGENGAGKSTLLGILAGDIEPDRGIVSRPGRTGLLRQEVVHGPRETVGDLIKRAIAPLRALETEVRDAAAHLTAATSQTASERYERALAAAEAAELWTVDSRRDALLAGLGVGRLPLDRPLAAISGGQRSRVALAALLLSRPDALVLDEPTNHLDDAAVGFLREQLLDWRGPVIFASHDRAFLDEVATALVDIDPNSGARSTVSRFGGSYTDYLGAKAAERARWEARFEAEEQELRELELSIATTSRDIAHNRPWRDNDRMAKGLKKNTVEGQISRRVRNARGRLDDLERSRVERPTEILSFAGIPNGWHSLEDADALISVENARVEGRLAIDDLTVGPTTRLLLTGANGAGKSSLLELLAGQLATTSGSVRRRRGLRVGLLAQDVRWKDATRSARVIYRDAVGDRREETVPLSSLGLLPQRDLDRAVGSLSIGQQRRLALATIIARPPHVFLLDEPTNHLSLGLATELEDALGGYPGAVIIASHDRWLRRRWSGPHRALIAGSLA